MMAPKVWLFAALLAAHCIACSDEPSGPEDTGDAPRDTGTRDATVEPDAGHDDTGPSNDTGVHDDATTGPQDGGTPDTGPPIDAGPLDPSLWPMAMVADPTAADCQFENQRMMNAAGMNLDVWDLSFNSYESVGGNLNTIRIRGYALKPQGMAGPFPGVVQNHGLGGFANVTNLAGLATLTGPAFLVNLTGPGSGPPPNVEGARSEGMAPNADNGRKLFDTVPDPRGSWLWAYSIAAMRAVTCLQTRPEVDDTKIGMTGVSAGGIATLVSSGVDARLTVGVARSAALGFAEIIEAPQSWEHDFLTGAMLTTADPEWAAWVALFDPVTVLSRASGLVMLVDGSTDELFPLTGLVPTYRALSPDKRRLSIIANYDHGSCFQRTGGEPEATIAMRSAERAGGGQRMWMRHAFGSDPRYATIPADPVATFTAAGAQTMVSVVVDEGTADLEVNEVRVWSSSDAAVLWNSSLLTQMGPGMYVGMAALDWNATTPPPIAFVDVTYGTTGAGTVERFSLSSEPAYPPGFVPRIRRSGSCMP